MSNSVQMPALGESVTEGTVTRWLKQVGERVEVDEPLLEVSTDKVDTEIPSPVAGILQKILVAEDETASVGAQLALIGDEPPAQQDEPAPAADAEPPAEAPSRQAPSAEEPSDEEASAEEPSDEEPSAEAGAGTRSPATAATPPSSSGGGAPSGEPVKMPALGESVTEGTITRWLKRVGDRVEADEPLFEVSTDKVDTEVPSPVSGFVQQILVGEDETAVVGADVVIIGGGAPAGTGDEAPGTEAPGDGGAGDGGAGEGGEEPRQRAAPGPAGPAGPARNAEPQASPAPSPTPSIPPQGSPSGATSAPSVPSQVARAQPPAVAPAPPAAAQSQPSAADMTDSYVTPLVRKLAAEHGVDLATLQGTGVGGRIRKQDVLAAAERNARAAARPVPPVPAEASADSGVSRAVAAVSAKRGTTEKMTRLRRVIAQRMVESLQVSAQLTTVIEVDVTKIARLRARAGHLFEVREGVKLSYLAFFAKAIVDALKQHPVLNASVEGDTIVYHPQENLGIAVDTERGLLVPVIKDAGDLSIAGLARKIAELADRTRTNKITPDDLGGGTFTLTNTGSRGALFDTPILNQPQVGILGTGAVVKRPVVVEGAGGDEAVAIHSMAYLALSYDHRIVDGADAARFLVTLRQRLEEASFEADLGL